MILRWFCKKTKKRRTDPYRLWRRSFEAFPMAHWGGRTRSSWFSDGLQNVISKEVEGRRWSLREIFRRRRKTIVEKICFVLRDSVTELLAQLQVKEEELRPMTFWHLARRLFVCDFQSQIFIYKILLKCLEVGAVC